LIVEPRLVSRIWLSPRFAPCRRLTDGVTPTRKEMALVANAATVEITFAERGESAKKFVARDPDSCSELTRMFFVHGQ